MSHPSQKLQVQQPKTSVLRSTEWTGRQGRTAAVRSDPWVDILALQDTVGNWAVNRTVQSSPDNSSSIGEGTLSAPFPVRSRSGGHPLAPNIRTAMELRFGCDFHNVRVHKDSDAEATAAALGAQAVTIGSHIWFGSNKGPADQEVLSHELAHVVQQALGKTSSLNGLGGSQSVRNSLEQEALRASSQLATNSTGSGSVGRSAHPLIAPHHVCTTAAAIQLLPESVFHKGKTSGQQTSKVSSTESGNGRLVQLEDQDIGKTYMIMTNSRAFLLNYVDYNTKSGEFDPQQSKLWITYTDGRVLEMEYEKIPIGSHTTLRTGTVSAQMSERVFFKRGGFIYPQLYSEMTTSNLIAIKATIEYIRLLRKKSLENIELMCVFVPLMAASIQFLSTPRLARVWVRGSRYKGTTGMPKTQQKAKISPQETALSSKPKPNSAEGSISPEIAPIGTSKAQPKSLSTKFGSETGPSIPKPISSTVQETAVPKTALPKNQPKLTAKGVGSETESSAVVRSAGELRDWVKGLMDEHPGLNSRTAHQAVKGAEYIKGQGGGGPDVVLKGGRLREVTVISGKTTKWQDILSKLAKKKQIGELHEFYIQINSGLSKRILIRWVNEVKGNEVDLVGKLLKFFGPDGELWWSGLF